MDWRTARSRFESASSWNSAAIDHCDADDDLSDEELDTLRNTRLNKQSRVRSASRVQKNAVYAMNVCASSLNESTCTFYSDVSACSFTEEEIFSFGGQLTDNRCHMEDESSFGQEEEIFFSRSRSIQRSSPIAIPSFIGRS